MKFAFCILACIIAHVATAQLVVPLSSRSVIKEFQIQEISGLIEDTIASNGYYQFWAMADGGAPARLYKYMVKPIDSQQVNGQNVDTAILMDSTTFTNVSNIDWEELTASPSHIFIGDFGNNQGNRRDLRIYRFPKTSLGQKNVTADTLYMSYAAQVDFSNKTFHAWDCEAMYWANDSLTLISKGLDGKKIQIYSMPDKPGTYSLKAHDSFQSTQMITGASSKGMNKNIGLCAYNFNSSLKLLGVFSNFANGQSFDNRWSKASDLAPNTSPEIKQVESICYPQYFPSVFIACAQEAYDGSPAYIHYFGSSGNSSLSLKNLSVIISPNPVDMDLKINMINPHARLIICNTQGQWLCNQALQAGDNLIDLTGYIPGYYVVNIYTPGFVTFSQKILKL